MKKSRGGAEICAENPPLSALTAAPRGIPSQPQMVEVVPGQLCSCFVSLVCYKHFLKWNGSRWYEIAPSDGVRSRCSCSAAAAFSCMYRACIVHANEISQNSGKYSENDAIRNGGNPYHVHMHGKTRKHIGGAKCVV